MKIPNRSTSEKLDAALSRRAFLTRAGATAALGSSALLLGTPEQASAQRGGAGDADIVNFALNLEYLEAEFYSYATTGQSITAAGVDVSGSGSAGPSGGRGALAPSSSTAPGNVIVKPGSTIVPFVTPSIRQFANEITEDERNHVVLERNFLTTIGARPIARPQIDLFGSFNRLAQDAGLVPQGGSFDPFANELNFLLATFVFEDVGVTAYKGASPLIANKTLLETAAGVLAVEAYHAGITRRFLAQLAETTPSVATQVQQISELRDRLDVTTGAPSSGRGFPPTPAGNDDRDQGILPGQGFGNPNNVNLVPTDAMGVAYSRTTRQVLNIVYGAIDASSGLFFPQGLNGAIR